MQIHRLKLCFLFCLISITSKGTKSIKAGKNGRPVIGILALDSSGEIKNNYKWSYSYIDAAYVKFVEMGGARVLPILIDHPDEYYAKMFQLINGFVFPGEGVTLSSSRYFNAASKLFDLTLQANKKGDYFPIWGSGLGFEALLTLMSNDNNWSTTCSLDDFPSSVVMTKDFQTSRLFGSINNDIYEYLTTMPVASNFHPVCVNMKKFRSSELDKHLHALSVHKNNDSVYVTSFEAFRYPFYGINWHPEKNAFEWRKTSRSPHSLEAVQASQYFGNFFVEEVRRNNHVFADDSGIIKNLIYNYRTYQLQNTNVPFTELYLFKNTTNGK